MWKLWTVVLCLLMALGAVSTIEMECFDDADDPGRGMVVDHGRGPDLQLDLPLLAGLEARRVVAEEPGDAGDSEAVEAASTVVAVAEPCGSRYPTADDILRATWAVGHFEDGHMDWAVVPLLEVEWCESCRRTTEVGLEWELGPFQFKQATWERFTALWMKERPDLPPVDPLDPWDAALMTVFAWQQGKMHEWSCWGRW